MTRPGHKERSLTFGIGGDDTDDANVMFLHDHVGLDIQLVHARMVGLQVGADGGEGEVSEECGEFVQAFVEFVLVAVAASMVGIPGVF